MLIKTPELIPVGKLSFIIIKKETYNYIHGRCSSVFIVDFDQAFDHQEYSPNVKMFTLLYFRELLPYNGFSKATPEQ